MSRRSRRGAARPWLSLVLVLATLAAVAVADTGTAAAAAPTPRTFGVTLPGVPTDLSGLQALQTELGHDAQTVMWYQAWSSGTGFPATAAAQIAASGATPEVTWEPWDPSAWVAQPKYALARIASGAFDSYISSWARQIRGYGKPVILRFAHEMNGNWYPWSEQVNGNRPGDYVAAWRHVHAVFDKNKVTNVTWLWSPNVPYAGSTDLGELYPGDASVDEVALDGYNWSTLQTGSTWQSFDQVFDPGLAAVESLTTRPVSIGEVGCPEVGGDKPAWITDMFSTLSTRTDIRGFVWFDYTKETDWRIDSSAGSLDAFASGLSTFH